MAKHYIGILVINMNYLVGYLGSVNVGLKDYLGKAFGLVSTGHHIVEVGNFWFEVLEKQAALDKPKYHKNINAINCVKKKGPNCMHLDYQSRELKSYVGTLSFIISKTRSYWFQVL